MLKWSLNAVLVVCVINLVASTATQPQTQPAAAQVALEAAFGAELIHYDLAVDQASLTRRESIMLPGAVQYAWPHPSGRYLYVAWSAGPAQSDAHGLSAFALEPGTGRLRALNSPIPLRYRPIHLTTDRDGTHVLVVYNDPAGVTVFNLGLDGTIGTEVPEPQGLDVGIYVHQARVEPSNHIVILVARGNYERRHDPGALKTFNYRNGTLTNQSSAAPNDGENFNPRHLDFDKSGRFAFVTLEAQNKLEVFEIAKDGSLSSLPLFSRNTLLSPNDTPIEHRQLTGTVHVHPNGRVIYTANRATGTVDFHGQQVFAGGENNIAVFTLDPATAEPTLVQNADTHGMVPRTFALDPNGRVLVAANQSQRLVRDDDSLQVVPASLAVFKVRSDGRLDFVRTFEMKKSARANLIWMGMMPIPR